MTYEEWNDLAPGDVIMYILEGSNNHYTYGTKFTVRGLALSQNDNRKNRYTFVESTINSQLLYPCTPEYWKVYYKKPKLFNIPNRLELL